MVDRRPAVVVRAATVDDVPPVIAAARAHGLDLAVRGGGHNVAGNGSVDGGLVLDLGDLTAVTVDAAASTVRVEGGATLAHVDAATEPHGLVVPLGVVSGTGVAGLTLGGGVGWLTRAHGLAADNLVSVELVTAAGERVTASETEHPDLFWALKGGGGRRRPGRLRPGHVGGAGAAGVGRPLRQLPGPGGRRPPGAGAARRVR